MKLSIGFDTARAAELYYVWTQIICSDKSVVWTWLMCSNKHSSMSKRMETFICLMESARHRDMEFQKNKLDI